MNVPICDDDGKPLDSVCSIEVHSGIWSVVLESRGGTTGKPNARNLDYADGFRLILLRLATLRVSLVDVVVESHKLLRSGLSVDDRRIKANDLAYPMVLTAENVERVTTALRRGQAEVATERKSESGGNTTRRVRISFAIPAGYTLPDVDMADYLTGTKTQVAIEAVDISETGQYLEEAGQFDANGIIDARSRVISTIARRMGQPAFRAILLEAYGQRCALSDCDAVEVLEAAHIMPYRGPATNHVQNGLLLRADLHVLFDRGLLGIDPGSWKVVLHSSLLRTQYQYLNETMLRLPSRVETQPSREALGQHLIANGLVH